MTLAATKKEIEKALKQIGAISNADGRITLTYQLPLGENMKQRLDNFDNLLASINADGFDRFEHIFSKGKLEVYIFTE